MTKQDFVQIANVIRELPTNTTRADVAEAFARALPSTNELFKVGVFLVAALGPAEKCVDSCGRDATTNEGRCRSCFNLFHNGSRV